MPPKRAGLLRSKKGEFSDSDERSPTESSAVEEVQQGKTTTRGGGSRPARGLINCLSVGNAALRGKTTRDVGSAASITSKRDPRPPKDDGFFHMGDGSSSESSACSRRRNGTPSNAEDAHPEPKKKKLDTKFAANAFKLPMPSSSTFSSAQNQQEIKKQFVRNQEGGHQAINSLFAGLNRSAPGPAAHRSGALGGSSSRSNSPGGQNDPGGGGRAGVLPARAGVLQHQDDRAALPSSEHSSGEDDYELSPERSEDNDFREHRRSRPVPTQNRRRLLEQQQGRHDKKYFQSSPESSSEVFAAQQRQEHNRDNYRINSPEQQSSHHVNQADRDFRNACPGGGSSAQAASSSAGDPPAPPPAPMLIIPGALRDYSPEYRSSVSEDEEEEESMQQSSGSEDEAASEEAELEAAHDEEVDDQEPGEEPVEKRIAASQRPPRNYQGANSRRNGRIISENDNSESSLSGRSNESYNPQHDSDEEKIKEGEATAKNKKNAKKEQQQQKKTPEGRNSPSVKILPIRPPHQPQPRSRNGALLLPEDSPALEQESSSAHSEDEKSEEQEAGEQDKNVDTAARAMKTRRTSVVEKAKGPCSKRPKRTSNYSRDVEMEDVEDEDGKNNKKGRRPEREKVLNSQRNKDAANDEAEESESESDSDFAYGEPIVTSPDKDDKDDDENELEQQRSSRKKREEKKRPGKTTMRGRRRSSEKKSDRGRFHQQLPRPIHPDPRRLAEIKFWDTTAQNDDEDEAVSSDDDEDESQVSSSSGAVSSSAVEESVEEEEEHSDNVEEEHSDSMVDKTDQKDQTQGFKENKVLREKGEVGAVSKITSKAVIKHEDPPDNIKDRDRKRRASSGSAVEKQQKLVVDNVESKKMKNNQNNRQREVEEAESDKYSEYSELPALGDYKFGKETGFGDRSPREDDDLKDESSRSGRKGISGKSFDQPRISDGKKTRDQEMNMKPVEDNHKSLLDAKKDNIYSGAPGDRDRKNNDMIPGATVSVRDRIAKIESQRAAKAVEGQQGRETKWGCLRLPGKTTSSKLTFEDCSEEDEKAENVDVHPSRPPRPPAPPRTDDKKLEQEKDAAPSSGEQRVVFGRRSNHNYTTAKGHEDIKAEPRKSIHARRVDDRGPGPDGDKKQDRLCLRDFAPLKRTFASDAEDRDRDGDRSYRYKRRSESRGRRAGRVREDDRDGGGVAKETYLRRRENKSSGRAAGIRSSEMVLPNNVLREDKYKPGTDGASSKAVGKLALPDFLQKSVNDRPTVEIAPQVHDKSKQELLGGKKEPSPEPIPRPWLKKEKQVSPSRVEKEASSPRILRPAVPPAGGLKRPSSPKGSRDNGRNNDRAPMVVSAGANKMRAASPPRVVVPEFLSASTTAAGALHIKDIRPKAAPKFQLPTLKKGAVAPPPVQLPTLRKQEAPPSFVLGANSIKLGARSPNASPLIFRPRDWDHPMRDRDRERERDRRDRGNRDNYRDRDRWDPNFYIEAEIVTVAEKSAGGGATTGEVVEMGDIIVGIGTITATVTTTARY
ncbi:unnamed protein product [Amoebophrya sp. A120]|nr:unnamed protein product [Amoebophrya sp. A120]|eukprot:GSA120T00021831001.1